MATIFITRTPGVIKFIGRMESAGVIGDFIQELRPGQMLGGRTYAQWRRDERTTVSDEELFAER
jgi:hypothetical protein